MFYRPSIDDHGLPYSPFKSCVVPRPIGWISTMNPAGVSNLAPYSQFTNVSYDPPMVMFAANRNQRGEQKDSVRNAEATGEFVWNMATHANREAVNASAQGFDYGVDEFEQIGLRHVESRLVRPFRVASSPVGFECKHVRSFTLPGDDGNDVVDLVVGRVIGIHIDDEAIGDDGKLDIVGLRPIARLGYLDYTSVDSTFSMIIPGKDPEVFTGMEGPSAHLTREAPGSTAVDARGGRDR